MKYSLIVILLSAFLSVSCAERNLYDPTTMPANTFNFLGNALVCISDELDDSHNACFRIGKYKVGDVYRPTEKPWKEIAGENGVTQSVFSVISNEQYQAYFVIGHKNKKIVSIQFTGNYAHEKLSFSTIMLGDEPKKVRKILGPNYSVTTVESIKGIMWNYYPFRITLEFVDGKVYSIKILGG